MNDELRILMLEDSTDDAELLERQLKKAGITFRALRVDTKRGFIEALSSFRPTIILSDYSLPTFDGAEALKVAREKAPDVPYIYVSGNIGEERAIDALHSGATDYVLKDRLGRLVPAVKRALRELEERKSLKSAEEELRQSEMRFRTLIENSTDAIALLALSGKIKYVSSTTCRILGYAADRLIGKNPIRFVHRDHRREIAGLFQSLLRKPGAVVDFQARFLREEGSFRWLEGTAQNLLTDSNVEAIVLNFRDVSERKQSEEFIKIQTSYFQQLFENSPAGIAMCDTNLNIINANGAFATLFLYDLFELRGKNIDELIVPQIYRPESTRFIAAARKGEIISRLSKRKRKDGTLVPVRIIIYPIRVEEKRVGMYCIYLDMTEQRQLEEQLLRAQRLENIGTLASGIAHDLNNILAPIMMTAKLLQDSVSDPHARKLLGTLEMSAQRGADIVKQVLLFSRGVRSDMNVLNVKYHIREIENFIRETFPKSIQVRVNMPKDLRHINGDATQLHQVLLNLSVNARDAMPDGGTLTLKAENVTFDLDEAQVHPDAHPGPYVLITMTDSGSGISPEIMDKIFDPFYTTKEEGKGTGLGLSTSIGIVKNHDGFITVASEVGKGTEFKIFFPAIETLEFGSSENLPGGLIFGDGELILYVDDEKTITDIARMTLESSGYEVLIAGNGQEALSRFSDHRQDLKLVITDISMPVMDGTTFIENIRRMDPEVKIIITSGVPNNDNIRKTCETFGCTFMAKPFSSTQLLRTMYSVLHAED